MLMDRIERVLRHQGVIYVIAGPSEQVLHGESSHAGEQRFYPLVVAAEQLRAISGESCVRVLVGDHIVLVAVENGCMVALVFVKGHPVVKSVVRMVRQLMRQMTPRPAMKAREDITALSQPSP